jgi:hypothetical protein
VCVFSSKYKHYCRCLLRFAEDRFFMNLVWDASRIWSVVFTVVWDAMRIWFVVYTEQNEQKLPRYVHANSRACPFLLITNACPHARIDRWWRSRAPITVSESSNRPITSRGRFLP